VTVPGLGALLHLREVTDDDHISASLRWQPEPALPARGAVIAAWDGSLTPAGSALPLPEGITQCAAALAAHAAVFIAHRRALPEGLPGTDVLPGAEVLPPQLIGGGVAVWVPGVETWFALARRNLWVQGCAEGLGFETLRPSLGEPVLQLPALREWLVLTHADAVAGWQMPDGPRVLATYRHAAPATPVAAMAPVSAAGSGPLGASHVYWHSAAQFKHWADGGRARFGTSVHHACAFGKTAARLRAAGLTKVTEFPSVQQWREWLRA
jgi:hypothetical protein